MARTRTGPATERGRRAHRRPSGARAKPVTEWSLEPGQRPSGRVQTPVTERGADRAGDRHECAGIGAPLRRRGAVVLIFTGGPIS